MRYFSGDIETTGLKPKIHGVTEIAFVLGDTNDPTLCKKWYRWLDPDGYVWSNYCLRLHAKWIDRVTQRMMDKQTEKLSEMEPRICRSLNDAAQDLIDWLDSVDPIGPAERHKLTATGKNFGTFDAKFLEKESFFESLFRHRSLDWVPFYQAKGDKLPPELKLCKARAIEAGCERFVSPMVAHNALDDALDVHYLIQFAYNEADIDLLRKANEKVS